MKLEAKGRPGAPAGPLLSGVVPSFGIEMFGNSIPAETAGGDLFEYIDFQQRYDIVTGCLGICLEALAGSACRRLFITNQWVAAGLHAAW
jgi:hypothetical protein